MSWCNLTGGVRVIGVTKQITLCGNMKTASEAAEVLDVSFPGVTVEAVNGCIKATSEQTGTRTALINSTAFSLCSHGPSVTFTALSLCVSLPFSA